MERRTRVYLLAVLLLALLAGLGIQAVTADPTPVRSGEGAYPGNTLITVQSYGWFDQDNGRALIVNPEGEVVWAFDPPDTRVFDAEIVRDGNVMVTMATRLPATECPLEYLRRGTTHCIENRVVELDRETKRVVWNYSWHDVFMTNHEVHDADRLDSGETAIIDMGNDRVFTVNREGEVTWTWSAEEHIGPGTEFWETYVPEDAEGRYRPEGPESDWTHMNDIDRLENGNFQLSIRNFDVVIEVDPATGRIVDVIGRPGDHRTMNEQHNPNRIEHAGTLLVADSENNRVIELDVETGEVVWSYVGTRTRLQWPRDVDRLPNGNTLIVDSRNFRVLEINGSGTVVWAYSLQEERGIPYDADRIGLPEEPDDVPAARSLDATAGPADGLLTFVASWVRFVLPVWVGGPELLTILAGVGVSLWLAVDAIALARERRG